jgi:hypothetical protein
VAKTFNFIEACSFLVRKLIRMAYAMPEGSVRPANQEALTGVEGEEFATVRIIGGISSDFGAASVEYADDPTLGSTQVLENIDNVYRFTVSVQFFRHADPGLDGAGQSPFGLSAVDKAARLAVVLSSSTMMELQERMGIGLEDASDARDIGTLVHSATWEDRGSVDLTFVIVNREQFMLESIGCASVSLEVQEPGQAQLTTATLEVVS